MSSIHLALKLSLLALDVLWLPPLPVLFMLAALGVLWSGWTQSRSREGAWMHRYWGVLTQLLYFPAAIAVGVIRTAPFTGYPHLYHVDRVGGVCLQVLSYASLASGFFWICRMNLQGFAISLVIFIQLPVFAAISVAGMTVTGDWL